jgi:hypothetical protein
MGGKYENILWCQAAATSSSRTNRLYIRASQPDQFETAQGNSHVAVVEHDHTGVQVVMDASRWTGTVEIADEVSAHAGRYHSATYTSLDVYH